MHYQYVVILKKESERTTDLLSLLLCLLSSINFLYYAVRSSSWFLGAAGAVLLTGLVVNYMLKRKYTGRVRYRYLLLVAALGWLAMPYLPWVGGLFIVLAFLEYQTKRPLEIGFDSDRVVINSLIRRRYDWSAFSNIILRDGLLTMDFRNNRLLQKEVLDDEEEDDADEDEFNEYCQERLAEAEKK